MAAKDCPVGTCSDQTGQDAAPGCKACGVGKYNDQVGQDAEAGCKQCAVGKYSDQAGQDGTEDCKDCCAGTVTPAVAGGAGAGGVNEDTLPSPLLQCAATKRDLNTPKHGSFGNVSDDRSIEQLCLPWQILRIISSAWDVLA